MIKILIADDHPIVRRGLKQIISETVDMEVTGEASNGQEVINKVRKDNYDIILLDLSMPVRSGLDILKELKTKYKLAILTNNNDVQAARILEALDVKK